MAPDTLGRLGIPAARGMAFVLLMLVAPVCPVSGAMAHSNGVSWRVAVDAHGRVALERVFLTEVIERITVAESGSEPDFTVFPGGVGIVYTTPARPGASSIQFRRLGSDGRLRAPREVAAEALPGARPLVLAEGGSIHVLWGCLIESVPTGARVCRVRSDDRGRTFTRPEAVESLPSELLALAAKNRKSRRPEPGSRTPR